MCLVWNWKIILRKAWSIRLIVLAALLSGLEVALPLLDLAFVPPGWFAFGSFLVTAGAFVARIVAQPSIRKLPS